MSSTELNNSLIDSYLSLLKGLSNDNKLKLISRLSDTLIKNKNKKKKSSLKSLYGALISEQSADEIIQEIKESRNFSRNEIVI